MKTQWSLPLALAISVLFAGIVYAKMPSSFADQESQTEQAATPSAPESGNEDVAESTVDNADESPLMTLDWLVGEWAMESEGAAASQNSAGITARYTKNNAFLILSFSFTREDRDSISGMQVIAWDPAEEHVRSWTYDSNGGFGQGTWSQLGDAYTIRTRYTLADGGTASSLRHIKFVDENTFTMRTINRELDGKLMPDEDPITLVRQSTESDAVTEDEAATASETNDKGEDK